MLVFFPIFPLVILLALRTSSASASSIFVRQDSSDRCVSSCYPTRTAGSDETSYNNQLCKDQATFFDIVNCFQRSCSGNGLTGAISDIQARCNSVGVSVSISINSATNPSTPTPTPTTTPLSPATGPSSPATTPSTTTTSPSTTSMSPSTTATSPLNSSTDPLPSSPSPSSSSPPSPGPSSSISIAPIVGGAIGVIIALIILIFSIIMYRRRSQKSQKRSRPDSRITASLTKFPHPPGSDERDDESVILEKPYWDDPAAGGSARGPHPSADIQRQPDGGSGIPGSQPSSVGHWDGLSEGGTQDGHHRAGEVSPAPSYDEGLARRVTNCGYQPRTSRLDIGAVLKYELSSGPPVYEEEVGLLEGGSSAGHHGG